MDLLNFMYRSHVQWGSTQLNSTQLNSTQLNSTHLNSTQLNSPQLTSTQQWGSTNNMLDNLTDNHPGHPQSCRRKRGGMVETHPIQPGWQQPETYLPVMPGLTHATPICSATA